MKLAAAIKRTDAAAVNISNALSFLQTQAGSLKNVSAVLDRMSELATLANDITKSTPDSDNYSVEYGNLVSELSKLSAERFNGISLFNAFNSAGTAGALTVYLSEDASQNMTLSQASLFYEISGVTSGLGSVKGTGIAQVTDAIQRLSSLMATNGAQASRLQFALDSLSVNKVNLEAANSRIYDVDVAAETTKLARANILVQSGASMLSQANAVSQIALKLLQ